MSAAPARRLLLSRLGGGGGTALLAILLELPMVPAWADGVDATGRAVLLIGRHALGATDTAEAAIAAVLEALGAGEAPDGVQVVAYAPHASAAIAEVVAGTSAEVLLDGPRGSGKTQATPAALAILAELHARAGFALPLRALWLHDSLTNASVKTGRSLESPMWSGLWTLREDRRLAVLTVGGVEMVQADFVGTQDTTSGDRARAECHVVTAEELVPSLDESGGIEERKYELALTSARLATRRKVAVCTTNPGDVTTWPYRRWIEGGGQPGTARCPVPASDRLSPAEVTALRAAFRDSPDLERRLALGEWSSLKLGEVVAEGYDPAIHVGPERLVPSPRHALAIGWDGGHSPSAVIAQLLDGQVQIFAVLNDLKVGVLELIEDQVIPWLVTWAPWARQHTGDLVHVIDPSMATPGQATIRESAERTIRETLRGRIVRGPVAWSPRREAILRVLAPRHVEGRAPLVISPVRETELLRHAFAARWYYPKTADGRVDRSRPKKPNSPWADVGDAAAYVLGWLKPGSEPDDARLQPAGRALYDVNAWGER
jgi:hypothetical protein